MPSVVIKLFACYLISIGLTPAYDNSYNQENDEDSNDKENESQEEGDDESESHLQAEIQTYYPALSLAQTHDNI